MAQPGISGTPQGYGGNGGTVAIGTTTTDTGLTVNQKRFYTGVMITRMLPPLTYLANDGEKSTVPENSGGFTDNSIRFLVQGNALPLATTALLEGEPPSPNTLDWREKATRLAQYGGVAKHTDILEHAGLSNVITQISEALGEQAGKTLHALMMNIILGGTNVIYGGGAANRAGLTSTTTHKFTASLIKRAARDLSRRGVPKFSDGLYHCVISQDQMFDLQDDPVWQALSGALFTQTVGANKEVPGESSVVMFGVKVMSSPHNTVLNFAASTWANYPNTGDTDTDAAINVHQGVVYGKGAFGFFDHAAWKIPALDRSTGKGMRIYMVPADREDKFDPLGQIGVLGWKVSFGGLILDQRKIVRIETSSTLNDTIYDYSVNSTTEIGGVRPGT